MQQNILYSCVVTMLLPYCKLHDLSLLTEKPSFLYIHNESLKCFQIPFWNILLLIKKYPADLLFEPNKLKNKDIFFSPSVD